MRPQDMEGVNCVINVQDVVKLAKRNPSNMKKYRIKEWKNVPVSIRHTWLVQKRRRWFFWRTINLFKTYQEAEEYIKKLLEGE